MQEDFCPPNGSLAVSQGRDIIPVINDLLALPFDIKIATKDWHPPNHISFAANHLNKQPFIDTCTVTNPFNPAESYETRLWPVHCVQDTDGARLVSGLELPGEVRIIEKGTDARVEMYSAFCDPLRVSDSGLKEMLKREGVSDVFVVGLAADYCVKSTAADAKREGFRTFLVEEGTRAVDVGAWDRCRGEIEGMGVRIVSVSGSEVGKVRARAQCA